MPKDKRHTLSKRARLEFARHIVQVGMRFAHKELRPEFVDLIAAHIVATLPARTMRAIARDKWASKLVPQAYKLAVPFLRAAT